MTAAFVWSTTHTALVAAANAASGLDHTLGLAEASALSALGTAYDSAYTAAVDTAKVAWLAGAGAAWTGADHLCAFAEDLDGSPGAPLAFNAYDRSALLARLSAAASKATTAALKSSVALYGGALESAWTAPLAPYNADVTEQIPAPTVQQSVLTAARKVQSNAAALAQIAQDAGVSLEVLQTLLRGERLHATRIIITPALRPSELELVAKTAEATALIAVLGYP